MKDYIIRTENLGFTYDDGDDAASEIPALSGVSINIERGEYVAILGHNGSGKSTLAKLLNMILTPSVGKIYIDGTDITAEEFSEYRASAVRTDFGDDSSLSQMMQA